MSKPDCEPTQSRGQPYCSFLGLSRHTPMNTTNGRAPTPAPPASSLAARIAALQAAATFAAGVVLGTSKPLSSQDVLRVAEAFEVWLDRPDRSRT